MEKINVFVSSTIEDIKEERKYIKNILNKLCLTPFLSEYASAHVETPYEVCFNNIKKSDIFLLVIGQQYGYIPKKDTRQNSPFNGKRSVTHGEFLIARELLKPILVFIKETERENKLENFVTELGDFLEGSYYTKFKGKEDLGRKIKLAISDILVKLVRHNYSIPWKWKPNVIIAENSVEASNISAKIMSYPIQNVQNANIGLFAGRTANQIYHEFFREFDATKIKNFKNVNFFSVTEHFGIHPQNKRSYHYWFHQALFNKIKDVWGITVPEEHIKLVPSSIYSGTIESFRIDYDQFLMNHIVDIQLMSPAPTGQFISIDPNYCSLEDMLNMGTSLVRYSKETSNYLVPICPHDTDIVIGIKNMLNRSSHLVIIAYGENKMAVVRRMIMGPIGEDCPASLIAKYKDPNKLLFIIDKDSSKQLPDEHELYINKIKKEDWINFY